MTIDFGAPVGGPESGTAGLGRPSTFSTNQTESVNVLSVCGHPIAPENDSEAATTSLLLCDLSLWLTVGPRYSILVFVLRAGHHTQSGSMHHVPSINDSLPNGVTLFAASRTARTVPRWPASSHWPFDKSTPGKQTKTTMTVSLHVIGKHGMRICVIQGWRCCRPCHTWHVHVAVLGSTSAVVEGSSTRAEPSRILGESLLHTICCTITLIAFWDRLALLT